MRISIGGLLVEGLEYKFLKSISKFVLIMADVSTGEDLKAELDRFAVRLPSDEMRRIYYLGLSKLHNASRAQGMVDDPSEEEPLVLYLDRKEREFS